jgi:putative ABC transport system substrate-binding protein
LALIAKGKTMDRRSFAAGLALGVGLAPLAIPAQTAGGTARVGFLTGAPPPTGARQQRDPWILEMRRLGWIEGQNLIVERRFADGNYERMPALAQELVAARPDVVMTLTDSEAAYVRRLNSTLPIVLVYTGMDPVADGLIASFARPGGNVTGVSRMLGGETRAKRLELIKMLLPAASRVGVLAPAAQGSQPVDTERVAKLESSLRKAAQALRIDVDFHWYRSRDELVAAFPAMAAARMQAFVLEPTHQTFANRGPIAELALQHRLPGVFTLREYAVAGGLMSYGPDTSAIGRQLAQQVDRILRGAKAGDLPMEQPTRFDLVLNLRTAKALGLAMPQPLLQRADELIE